jgi:hypothetical protein
MGCRNDTGFTKRDLQLSDLSSETAFFVARVKPGQRHRDSRHMLCYDRWRGYEASSLMMSIAIANRMQDFEDDDIPISARGRGEGFMEEAPATGSGAARRNEDIALDLMKFVAMTTGYGRTTSTGVGFQGTGSAAKPEDYAERLLELYGKCLVVVSGKR